MNNLAFLSRGKTLPRVKGECRVCSAPIPPVRRSFCSDPCRDLYYLATASDFLRFKVYARDHGVCAGCTQDCDDLERQVWGFSTMQKMPRRKQHRDAITRHHRERAEMSKELIKLGFMRLVSNHPVTLWEADHIEPLVDGGGFGLDNVQTLCQACHIEKTADEAHWRAKRKKLIGKKQTVMKVLLKRMAN